MRDPELDYIMVFYKRVEGYVLTSHTRQTITDGDGEGLFPRAASDGKFTFTVCYPCRQE